MKLYIGGICQGQAELARSENPGARIYYDFQENLRQVTEPREYALEFCEANPDAVVVADEVGSGVVPMDKNDRLWRERVGRALCVIAQHSESVTRAVCGIGVKLK